MNAINEIRRQISDSAVRSPSIAFRFLRVTHNDVKGAKRF